MGDRPRFDWGTWLVFGVATYALAYVAFTAGVWSFGDYTETVNEVADYPVLLSTFVLVVRASRAAPTRHVRRGWRLLAAAYLSLIIANAAYDYYGMVLESRRFPRSAICSSWGSSRAPSSGCCRFPNSSAAATRS